MDSKKCEAFVTAAETGSFTRAAEILGYTQAGITRLISSLEEELGFLLFVRSRRGVILTENGSDMLPLFREFLRADQNIRQLSSDKNGTVSGNVSIGSYFSVSALIMPDIINRFTKDYPNVKLTLMEGSNREMQRWLSERQVDCCFMAEPSDAYKNEIDWFPVLKDEIVAWLPKDHPLALSSSFPIDRLSQEPFIHTLPNQDTEIDRILASLKEHPQTRFTTLNAFTTYNMVAKGLGISLNQRILSEKWKSDVVILPFEPRQSITLGIAVPSIKSASPATRKLVETIRKHF